MILIDYKGGAAFSPFTPLPHLAGLIDNLADDPQLTVRARASLQGEVVRRQQQLKDADSSPSITHYRELRRERPDLPPMPHLFVVIDEFGELLTAEPDFMTFLCRSGASAVPSGSICCSPANGSRVGNCVAWTPICPIGSVCGPSVRRNPRWCSALPMLSICLPCRGTDT